MDKDYLLALMCSGDVYSYVHALTEFLFNNVK